MPRSKRLGTDYVDLYQIHRFDPNTPVEETMEALHDVVKAGKARYLGASSMWAWQFAKLQHAADLGGWTRFVSMQNQYSLLQREEEREMFGLLADQGVGSIPWSPLAKGRVARPWGEQTKRSENDPMGQRYVGDENNARSSRPSPGSPRPAASRWPRSRSPGCCATPSSRRRSSAPTKDAPPARRGRRARRTAHRRGGRGARGALHAAAAERVLTVGGPVYRRYMADVVLFHHIQGLTPGVLALADRWRAAGHTVHTPDLYGGRIFTSIDDGAVFVDGDDHSDFAALADEAVADLPSGVVYVGLSFGVMQAQRLAQTRPGAAGAVLCESCLPISGDWALGPWPDGVPVQVHGMDADEFFAGEGDLDAARELVDSAGDAELFVYPGDRHLFEDSSLPSYDANATELLNARVLGLLARV